MENNKILSNSVEELKNNNFDASLILDNKLPFVLNEKVYRVHMPSQSEQAMAEHKRNLIQLEYMSQEGCITKAQLIEKLQANKIIDIPTMDKKKEQLSKDLKNYWFLLATKDSKDNKKIAEYTLKISEIQDELQRMSIDMSIYLTPALECRLEKFYVEYLTSVCTEQQIHNGWNPLWTSFDDFNAADSVLSNKAVASMTWLLLNKG